MRPKNKEIENFNLKSEELVGIYRPIHVMLDPLVQLHEVFFRDDMVSVEVQNVIEEILEFVLLEVRQQILAIDQGLLLGDVVTVAPVYEGAPDMFRPSAWFLLNSVVLRALLLIPRKFCVSIFLSRSNIFHRERFVKSLSPRF